MHVTFEVRTAWILMVVTCFQFSETKTFNRHKSKENLAVIHHSHILKLAFLSEITIFTGEARQGVRSDCEVSLSKPQIRRTIVRWPALICSLVAKVLTVPKHYSILKFTCESCDPVSPFIFTCKAWMNNQNKDTLLSILNGTLRHTHITNIQQKITKLWLAEHFQLTKTLHLAPTLFSAKTKFILNLHCTL